MRLCGCWERAISLLKSKPSFAERLAFGGSQTHPIICHRGFTRLVGGIPPYSFKAVLVGVLCYVNALTLQIGFQWLGASARFAAFIRIRDSNRLIPFFLEGGAMNYREKCNHYKGILASSVPKLSQLRPVIVRWSTLFRARLGE